MQARGWVASIALVLCACASQKLALTGSPAVPAAQGTVGVSRGDNGNTQLDVEVKHLAPPNKISSGAQAFVVWARPAFGPPQNLGALRVDENLQGDLQTVTPLQDFLLQVTAEPSPTAQAPTGQPVLQASVSGEN